MGARAAELRAIERATAAKRELDATKVHLAKTKAVLQKSLEPLEVEQKAQSDAEREVVMPRGQMLGVEESNARLLEKVTQQEEGLSILKITRLELGGKIGSLEQELEMAKAAVDRGVEVLA